MILILFKGGPKAMTIISLFVQSLRLRLFIKILLSPEERRQLFWIKELSDPCPTLMLIQEMQLRTLGRREEEYIPGSKQLGCKLKDRYLPA